LRFTDFLKTTVLISAAAASALAAVTVAGAASISDDLVVPLAAGWWAVAAVIGAFLGRRSATTPPVARLLAAARTTPTLPEVAPGRLLVNRLWPLLVMTLVPSALAFLAPQIAGIATGFAIIWALAWRRQEAAVSAIEERDGVRFYIERTSPFAPIKLVRTPGFKSNLFEVNGATQAPTGTS
jgi:hypothetical protein